MLGSAAVSYAALPREAVDRCRRCAAMSETVSGFKAASRPAATPHFVKACLFSACLQLLATRPQYLPAVEGFLAICGSSSSRELQGDLLNAIDALFSAAASAGQFASLVPPPCGGVAIGRHRSAHGRLQSSPADDSPGSPRSGGSGSGLGAVLRRMKTSLSLRFTSPGQTPGELGGSARVGCAANALCGSCMSRRCEAPNTCQASCCSVCTPPHPACPPPPAEVSPAERCQSLQLAAEQGPTVGPLPTISEGPSPLGAPVPQPPLPLASWEEAEAWLWDARTWADLGCGVGVGHSLIWGLLWWPVHLPHGCTPARRDGQKAATVARSRTPVCDSTCRATVLQQLPLAGWLAWRICNTGRSHHLPKAPSRIPCRAAMLLQDPLAYRPLLLRLTQSGTSVLPMGALRLLASYARCAACCAPAVHGLHRDSGLQLHATAL